jgi:hypothetical protein
LIYNPLKKRTMNALSTVSALQVLAVVEAANVLTPLSHFPDNIDARMDHTLAEISAKVTLLQQAGYCQTEADCQAAGAKLLEIKLEESYRKQAQLLDVLGEVLSLLKA